MPITPVLPGYTPTLSVFVIENPLCGLGETETATVAASTLREAVFRLVERSRGAKEKNPARWTDNRHTTILSRTPADAKTMPGIIDVQTRNE